MEFRIILQNQITFCIVNNYRLDGKCKEIGQPNIKNNEIIKKEKIYLRNMV